MARKFQEVSYGYAPRSYGLVMLGYSLKPFGTQEAVGELLFTLIDKAKVAVIEYPEWRTVGLALFMASAFAWFAYRRKAAGAQPDTA